MSAAAPAGLQSRAELFRRRLLVAAINAAVYIALLIWLADILGQDGWSVIDAAILIAFAIAAPWSVLGVCNAALGFWLLHFHPRPLDSVAPFARAGETRKRLRARTAVLLTIRNEDAARALTRLSVVKADLDATGEGALFDWFVLSDTTDARIAAQEESEFARWRTEEAADATRLHYRRRSDNAGYKAGNIGDFCERFGHSFEFMIPLDADSLMDGETILRLVRIGEAYPRIGVIQSLVVGAPSRSAFARVFQFGMRSGMRSYTMGAAWWGADCGPFWGHNALVRIPPFVKHCDLPRLAGGGHILSHDQIEAALMRRAGYEVRVLPVESGSYEENPPTLLEFMRRDLRWCRGNMQYVELLSLPGLLPMSRFQLVWAISMFIGAPAWTAIILLGALLPLAQDVSTFPSGSATALYLLFLGFYLAPKLAGYADIVLTPGGLRRYGGATRVLLGAGLEIAASFIIGAVTTFGVTLLLARLPFEREAGWTAQSRDAHRLGAWETARMLWPPFAFGVLVIALAGLSAPELALWSAPLTFGYVAAFPFALASASPRLGAWFARAGLCGVPEEFAPPAIFDRLRGRPKTREAETTPGREPSAITPSDERISA
ncbi:glucans biosynthesis glucosyltransferase MdoH [Methylosinus sp. H3A]|uniref:glucans biosynthesis glucosyltransferase MdoH n=1 Tax=Methylosinus sp. H3A TaxID=2785786 RepID=UPI0018C26F07|nr:glucans biosynthesis glucosyltransferase MdoH [Methylosinus sp. H3A]MBG0811400.1 glucans biosynthesis glucosyltransferase MdoH [Methylosinus sp. H3A]